MHFFTELHIAGRLDMERRSMRAFILTLAGCLLGFSTVASSLATAQSTKPLPYLDTSLPKEQRAADLVSRMTLEEKVSEMMNSSEAIPRLGVARIRLVE